ncbi:uncharacterized protein LOC144165272 isoform X2 [Haemaphysalis longicornis]
MAEEPCAASAEQLAEEEQLVRRYLKEARKADGGWTGYLDSEDALKEFERDLARTNVSFQTELSTAFDVEKTGRLLFSAKQKGCILPIELECPFRILSKRTKGCVFGRERHNVHCEKPVVQDSATGDWDCETFAKRKRKVQGTKKKGCTARMHIKTIEMFPDYKIELPPESSAYKRKVASKATLAHLERALSSGDESVTRQVRVQKKWTSRSGGPGPFSRQAMNSSVGGAAASLILLFSKGARK